jgi:Lrp/AsnC family transcriptional regulator, regulator for asnA, asnC and gidA
MPSGEPTARPPGASSPPGASGPTGLPAELAHLELDRLDQEIVRHLQEDGRRPYREIGRALDVSEGTIRARVRRLMDAEALRVIAIADPFRLGYRVLAFVLVSVEPGENERVIEALVEFPEVTYVSACTGRFDVYIQVVCRDHDHLYELLSERLPAIGGIVRTETFTELKMYKVSYRYPALADTPKRKAARR